MVSYFLAIVGGWFWLANMYPRPPGPHPHATYWMCSMGMGMASYRGCVNVRCDERGLYLSVLPMFRAGHRPMLIPWEKITYLGTFSFLWIERYRFSVGSYGFSFRGDVGKRIRAHVANVRVG